MPVPKRRKSLSKSRMQRAANMKYEPAGHTHCASCGEAKMSHHVCPSCGKYKERQIIEVVEVTE